LVNNADRALIGNLPLVSDADPKPSNPHPAGLIGLLLLLASAPSAAATEAYSELSRVYYDFEVAGYCGLVTYSVGQGFRREENRLVERDGLERETINRLRGDAWQAAHAEWQNRGLGGFRNWCRTEGSAAAERFSARNPGSAP
jgi:hypothetical protein